MMSVPYEMLLHPELLTNEQLIYIIQERYLRIPIIEAMAREELLDIFHRYCVPYGQRQYRDSGRGKILNKTRNISPTPVVKQNVMHNSQYIKPSHSNSKRLKPLPDIISGHNIKRMKLEIQTTINTECNIKRKISNDNITSATDNLTKKKARKAITWP